MMRTQETITYWKAEDPGTSLLQAIAVRERLEVSVVQFVWMATQRLYRVDVSSFLPNAVTYSAASASETPLEMSHRVQPAGKNWPINSITRSTSDRRSGLPLHNALPSPASLQTFSDNSSGAGEYDRVLWTCAFYEGCWIHCGYSDLGFHARK